MTPKRIHIGTSGWYYKEWKGKFYPSNHKVPDFFSFYTRYFSTVEINSSFYHLPLAKTLQRWYTDSPDDFVFSIKASRYITHIKKLSEPEESTSKFFEVIKTLKEKIGPIIFQLPPNWKSNPRRLNELLKILPKEFRYAFELRDPDWLNNDIYQVLKDHNAAFCIYDFDKKFSPIEITADFVYVRFHGPDGKYIGSYKENFLRQWADHFLQWKNEGKDIYCYFDNTADGSAITNAQRLQFLISNDS